MPSTVRYSPVENFTCLPYQNQAPVDIQGLEVLFDNFIQHRIVKFKLQNNTNDIIDSAVVTLRFYKHYQRSRILVAKKDEMIVAYFGLMIRPGDIFGNDTEITFPPCGADELEIGVTRIFVREYQDAPNLPDKKREVFADASDFTRLNSAQARPAAPPAVDRYPPPYVPAPPKRQRFGAPPPAEEKEEERHARPLGLLVGLPAAILAIAAVLLYFISRS